MARTATMTLSQGREVELEMPNLYQALAASSGLPNPMLASVLKLLSDEGLLEQADERKRLMQLKDNLRGLYEIASLCLKRPVLRLDEEPKEGEIGPQDLAFADLSLIYWNFFRADPPGWRRAAGGQEPETAQGAVAGEPGAEVQPLATPED